MRSVQERLVRESSIENHLLKCVKQRRGLTIKIMFLRGWPDRIVLLPGGVILFVELKRPVGGKFEPLQVRIHDKLRRLGVTVHVWHTKDLINNYFQGELP